MDSTDQRSFLGALDPRTSAVCEWASPTPASGPYGIAIGTDGRIWYSAARSNLMVAFNPISAQMETVTIPTPGCVVRQVVVDQTSERLWLALSGTGRIGRLDL